MSLNCPELAADTIEKLRDQGLEPTLDQIATLIELARRVQEPEHRTDPWLSYAGIRAGTSDHVLRPLSIKAGMWFDYIVDHLYDEHYKTMATAFAMEFGQDPAVDFRPLYDLNTAWKRIGEYAKTISCNPQELEEAMMRCMDEDLESDRIRASRASKRNGGSIEDTIAHLVAVTGQPESVWMSSTFTFAIAVLTHSLNHSASFYGADGDSANDMEYQRRMFDYIAESGKIQQDLMEEHNGKTN